MKQLLLLLFVTVLVAGCSAKPAAESSESITMGPEEALGIAQASDSCTDVGRVTSSVSLNEYTRTYWVDILQQEKPNCAPACVVNVDTGSAEVNWRCTGLIEDMP